MSLDYAKEVGECVCMLACLHIIIIIHGGKHTSDITSFHNKNS